MDRRRFLKLAGGAVGAAAVGQLPSLLGPEGALALDPAPFSLGVASGEPTRDGVILWTRLDPGPLSFVPVRWEVSENEAFTKIVKRDTYYADPEWHLSVHAQVDGLKPGRWYWYRFNAGGMESVIGRTRTLPPADAAKEPLRFAFASCQSWTGGAYPSYRDMAEQDLDFVLHLGDYIYETAARLARRVPAPARPVQVLGRAARGAREVPVHHDLGRPRGPEQLRGRDRRRRG